MSSLFSPGSDRRAYQSEWDQKRQVSSLNRPISDPTSAATLASRSFGREARLIFGRVVDGVAYSHCYKVLLSGGAPPMPCVLGMPTSSLPVGSRSINTLVMGSQVWVLVHPQATYGVIITVEPPWNTDPTLGRSDVIHGSSRSGLKVDRAHSSILDISGGGSVIDWSAGRPLDSTLCGEWGAITETGLKITLDSAMAQLAVDEGTGVFAFYHDQLLRVSGWNLQVQSVGHQEERLDSAGRILTYKGTAISVSEGLGVLTEGKDPLRIVDAQGSQVDTPYYGAVEPKNDDQIPFHRAVELGGFDGQGGKKLVLLPPTGDYFQASDTTPVPAVFEEQINLPGGYTVRSAKGIHFRKTLAIPGPRRAKRPEDRKTDFPEPRPVVGEVAASDTDHPSLQQAAAGSDSRAYASNYEGEAPLLDRDDWNLPEESKTPGGPSMPPISFGALADAQYLDRPVAVPMAVDARYTDEVPFYPNEAFIDLFDDGGVTIGDGYGSQIKMVAGNIEISTPGDIFFKSGKNLNLWAGHDLAARAKNSMDFSTTVHDIRIKAEQHVQVLAGNGGDQGALLLESRATASYGYQDKVGEDVQAGGVHIKSGIGTVAVWAQDLYLRAGANGSGGRLTLDAGRGTGEIATYSSDFSRYLGGTAFDYFGTEGALTSANAWSVNGAAVGSSLVVNGAVEVLKDGLIVNGYINVANGHIATQLADQYNNLVAPTSDQGNIVLGQDLDQGAGQVQTLIKDGIADWKASFASGLYAPDQPGAAATIAAVGFSFRNEEQYGTAKGWVIYEDRWQQLARLGGGAPSQWTEMPVKAGSTTTYPYPGTKPWTQDQSLLEQDLKLVDPSTGLAKDRDDPGYTDPRYAKPRPTVCNGHYAVIL